MKNIHPPIDPPYARGALEPCRAEFVVYDSKFREWTIFGYEDRWGDFHFDFARVSLWRTDIEITDEKIVRRYVSF